MNFPISFRIVVVLAFFVLLGIDRCDGQTMTLSFGTPLKVTEEGFEFEFVFYRSITEEMVQDYTVEVPYTVEISKEDGTTETVEKTRIEQRSRKFPVTRHVGEKQVAVNPWDRLKLTKLNGELAGKKDIEKAMAKKRKVLLLRVDERLPPLAAEVLNSEIVIVQQLPPIEPAPASDGSQPVEK